MEPRRLLLEPGRRWHGRIRDDLMGGIRVYKSRGRRSEEDREEEGISPENSLGGWGGAKKDETSGRERRDRREPKDMGTRGMKAHMGVAPRTTWREEEGHFLSHFHYCCLLLKNTKTI